MQGYVDSSHFTVPPSLPHPPPTNHVGLWRHAHGGVITDFNETFWDRINARCFDINYIHDIWGIFLFFLSFCGKMYFHIQS